MNQTILERDPDLKKNKHTFSHAYKEQQFEKKILVHSRYIPKENFT